MDRRVNRRFARLLLVLALAGAPLAQAQSAPNGGAPAEQRARLDAVARRYQAESWPAPGPRVAGVELDQVGKRLPGWTVETAVDPVRGEARLRLAPGGGAGAVTVLAQVRLFSEGAGARDALLASLGSLQATLDRAELGEVTYAGRKGGVPALVLAARGNVFVSVRALDQEAPVDVTPVASALLALAGDGPTLAPGQPLPAPSVVDLRVVAQGGGGVARAGQSARLEVVSDPRGPAAAHLRFECEGDVSIVTLPDGGLELLAPTAGSYTVRVWAASGTLAAAAPVELKVAIDP